MFTINIYLRFALIIGTLVLGILLATMYGFWYSFPFFLICIILLVGYLLTGTVQSAGMLLQAQDIEGAKKRLQLTFFPKLLFGPGRSAYYMLQGALSMQGKNYKEAEIYLKESEKSKYTSDNEKAMIYLQQANLAAMKNNLREAKMLVDKTDDLKVTEPVIREQMKQFKQALSQSGQMTMQNRILASQRGGSKQRRPRMR
jgi:hypothetical protein